MKISVLAAVAAVCLAGFGGSVYAQQNSSSDNGNITWIGSRTPSATESPATTRYEATSYLRQAKQDCQRDSSAQSRKDCMQSAQDEYKNMMGSVRSPSGSHSGSQQKPQ